MKKIFYLAATLLFVFSCKQQTPKNDLEANFLFAEQQLSLAQKQTDSIAKLRNVEDTTKIVVNPRSIDKVGNLNVVAAKDWCSGFFPGSLWYMYEHTKDNKWKLAAEKYTNPLESVKHYPRTHDLGFIMYCSFGNGYRLTGNKEYRDILITTANTLANRYSPIVKSIRSWDFNKDWQFPVIIDNMMNLELLFWASKETGDSRYYDIAVEHARTTMKNHFRSDYSTYHVVDYDIETGEVRMKVTHQGYADETAWARGQAWAIYGYTMCYRETKDQAFLDMANNIANYLFTHPNMPQDLVPYWDFDAPNIPNEPRDVSAATVIASALFELAQYNSEKNTQYLDWANTIIKSVSTNYLAKASGDYGFILQHSTGAKMHNSEVDVPLSYADYYYMEALVRQSKLK